MAQVSFLELIKASCLDHIDHTLVGAVIDISSLGISLVILIVEFITKSHFQLFYLILSPSPSHGSGQMQHRSCRALTARHTLPESPP